MQEYEHKKYVLDQQIDMNDNIANQLQVECNQLRQQLIEEKQYHYDQLQLAQQQVQRTYERNYEIQKQLTEEKKQRMIFFQQLQQKQSEVTKQLEQNIKDKIVSIAKLEEENQQLQNTLSVLKEQIEKLNIQELQHCIENQKIQLENKEDYIAKLKEENEKINVNHLQDKQIEKVISMLKTVDISE
ncbi:Hypothetical_protein [Hexamita inflata]|nr:Hypothetical protein HINF_LOCUS35078 [Hexamita inflata]